MKTTTRGAALKSPDAETAVAQIQYEVADAQVDLVERFAVIQMRAETVTVILEEVLHTCPPPRWGINE